MKRQPACPHRYSLLSFGTLLVAGLLGSLLPAQAQRGGGGVIGTPVSPDYKGLRTDQVYQPLKRNGVTPPPVKVVPISEELRSSYDISPFYTKTLTSAGVVIVGSDKVSDWAFLEAAYTLDHQLHESPQWVWDALSTNKVRLAIIACVEYTMDLPENSRDERMVARGAYNDRRSRGLGGLPDCSCAEENLLNLRGDPYGGDGSPTGGENITIHEFSHTVASAIGSNKAQGRQGKFWTDLRHALADAKATNGHLGIWNSAPGRRGAVYASSNEQEYWAEGAQAWFGHANPNNSGGLRNRDDVKQKDPQLAALLKEIYGDGPWLYHKTTAKNEDGRTMRPKEELAHLDGMEAVRAQFPVFNFNNSPRIIAQMKETAARAAEATATGGTNTPAATNAAPPSRGGGGQN